MSENHRYIEACEKCYLALRASTLPKKTSQRNQYLETCVWSIMSISHYLIIFSNFEHIIYMMFIIELLCDDVGCDRCAGLLRHRVTSSHIHSYPLISSCCLSSKLECHIISTMVHILPSNIYTYIQYIYIYISFLGTTCKAVTSNMVAEVLFLMFMIFIWGFPKMGVPPKHPKMVIFSRKTHGCWVPPFSETPIWIRFIKRSVFVVSWLPSAAYVVSLRFVNALAPATKAAVAHTEEICKRVALGTQRTGKFGWEVTGPKFTC